MGNVRIRNKFNRSWVWGQKSNGILKEPTFSRVPGYNFPLLEVLRKEGYRALRAQLTQ